MIKANELRIGNLIKSPPMSIPRLNIKSDGILEATGYGISFLESDASCKLGWQPIPLTEEILFNLGFYFDAINGSFEIICNDIKFTLIDKCGLWMVYLSGPFGMIILKHINSIHEIQNLHHSLTGTELDTSNLL